MTMFVRWVSVITADPGIVPVLPFVVSGNPDCRMIRTRPALILLWRRRRLIADLDNDSLCFDGSGGHKAGNHRHSHHD